MNAVIEADETSFEDFVEAYEGLCLVDFWGTGCPPCGVLSPIIDELAEEMKAQLRVVKLEVYENMGPAMKYNVSTIPTLILFKDGALKDMRRGPAEKRAIKEWVESHL
jgi:thioredoxin 1